MDYRRIALATVAAWVVDSVYGLVLWIVALSDQFASFPAVFRSEDTLNAGLPVVLGAGLLGIFALAVLYAKAYDGGNGVVEGIRFGVVLAGFGFCVISVPMYATLNIGSSLATTMALATFIGMTLTGTVIGSLYRPAGVREASRATPAGRLA